MLEALMVSITIFVLMTVGIYGILVSRNLIRLLICIETLFNAILLGIVAVGSSTGNTLSFGLLGLMAIVLTAVEVAVLTAVLILLYRRRRSLRLEALRELKG